MERSNRPQRNRRHSRRAWPPEDDIHYSRPAKRLFTPEIKRMLKEWLVRRRENPYPSREEKKRLALETGLTYTQICNWFANWRRKLKNSEREKSKKSWGHLIKHYNNNAKGNVEQFSISSEDSIWEEEEQQRQNKINKRRFNGDDYRNEEDESSSLCDIEGSNESTGTERYNNSGITQTQILDIRCKYNNFIDKLTMRKDLEEQFIGPKVDILPTTTTCHLTNSTGCSENITKTKYKQKMMEKYLRDTNDIRQPNTNSSSQPIVQDVAQAPTTYLHGNNTTVIKSETELSKWLESAAKFTPNKNNYYIEWNSKRSKLEKTPIITKTILTNNISANLQTSNTAVAMLPLLYSAASLVQTDNSQNREHIYDVIHHKDELEAAEALANLAFNFRQKIYDTTSNSRKSLTWPLNPISS